MKRMIAAAAFAVLAVPAVAFAADSAAPFEKTQFDRILPGVQNPPVVEQAPASAGPKHATGSALANGVWRNDWNVIAPPM